MIENGKLSITASGAIGAHLRVAPLAGTTTDPIQVALAGVGVQHIGVAEYNIADTVAGTIRTANDSGTVEVVAAGAFLRGAKLYGAAGGKVSGTVAGRSIGISFDAATADGDVIEMLQQPSSTSSIGFTSVHFTCLREVLGDDIQALVSHGGILAKNSNPIFEYINGDTDSCLRLNWAASDSNPVVTQAVLPPDFDAGQDLVFHFRAAMGGGTDTPVLDLDVYYNEGGTKVSIASVAITGTAYAEYTVTVAKADIPAAAQTMTFELTPAAHTTDALYVTAIWFESGTVD